MLSADINNLITLIGRLPGMGERSATRIVIHLLKHKGSVLKSLIGLLVKAETHSVVCKVCNNVDIGDVCSICSNKRRNDSLLCVVCDISDLWSIEMANFFDGTYHVLGGKLSAIDGVTPSDLNMDGLLKRISSGTIQEVIIATSADIDGQTTLYYVHHQLQNYPNIKITTLAHGVPIGTTFEYLDQNTIITAFNRRMAVQ